jgi:hypothetical protein
MAMTMGYHLNIVKLILSLKIKIVKNNSDLKLNATLQFLI